MVKIVRIAREELSVGRNTAERGKAVRIWSVFTNEMMITDSECNYPGGYQWFERASDNESGEAGGDGGGASRNLPGTVHWGSAGQGGAGEQDGQPVSDGSAIVPATTWSDGVGGRHKEGKYCQTWSSFM